MTTQTGTIYVKLDLDTTDFDKGLDSAANKAEKGGGFLSNALSFATGGALLGGLSAVKDSIFGIASAMIDGNAEFETYQTQFGVLLGSTDEAKKRLDELAKFGASTPFELPELVRADKVLTSFGIHSEEMLTIVGDVAAGTGASFEDMALLMGKFSAGSTGEVISRFQELGIATKDELAKMGIEFDKGGAMITPVAEAMPILENIMKDKFGGMMAAQSQTFSGMVSNLQDWVGGTIRTLGQPIFEVVKDKLGVLLTFLSSPEVVAALDAFATGMATAIGSTIDFISNTVIPAFITAWNLISPAINAIIPIINTIMEVFTAGGSSITVLGGQATWLGTIWNQLQEIINIAVKIIQATIVPIFNTIAKFINDHGDTIVKYLSNAWTIIQSVLNIALAIIKGVLKTFLAIITGDWQGAWNAIKEMFSTIWANIKTILVAALDNVKLVLSIAWDVIKSVASSAWNFIRINIIEATFNAIKGYIDSKLNEIKSALSIAWNAIQSTASTLWNGIKTAILTPFDNAKKGLDITKDAIKSALSDAWSSVKSTAGSKWDDIKSEIDSKFSSTKSKIDDIIGSIKGILSGAWDDIKSGASGAWSGIASAIGDAFDGVTGKIKGIVNQAIRYVNRLISAYNEVADTLGLGSLDRIPELARGTNNFRGGLALVGERGPELVALPRGSQVYPNGQTQQMLQRNLTVNNYFNTPVAPAQQLEFIESLNSTAY